MVLAVVLAGCSETPASATAPSLTPQPIATPRATASPEVSPTPIEPTSTPGAACQGGAPATAFEPDSIVCVVDGPLQVRSRPSTSGDSLAFEPFQAGQLLFVIDGPVEGSGSTWYLVEDTPGSHERADGWVAAAGTDGTPWLASASVSCPADPSLQDLALMDPIQRIHCYQDREFTFSGPVEGGAICGDGVVIESPAWMAWCTTTLWWGTSPKGIIVAIPPDLADEAGTVEPDIGFEATITAHMDDPVARTCVPHQGFESDYELLNPGTVLACRAIFVATSIQRVTP